MGPVVVLARSESASFYMAAGFAPAARFPALCAAPLVTMDECFSHTLLGQRAGVA